MGLLQILTGRAAKAAPPAPSDRLFALTTAYVTLETSFGIAPAGKAAVVVQPLHTPEFEGAWREVVELVSATAGEEQLAAQTKEDTLGYRWLILSGKADKPSVEGLAVAVNAASSTLEGAGHGQRLLCAVFPFVEAVRTIYLIYNYKRGSWYPFVPVGARERNNQRELELKGQLGADLPLEQEVGRWYPLWEIPL